MTILPKLDHDRQALRVQKRRIMVFVRFASTDGLCRTREGAVRYCAGDALLTGIEGETWPVQAANFHHSYRAVPPTVTGGAGRYIKTPAPTYALRLRRPTAVPVSWMGDPLRGRRGDWLLQYQDGSYGVVQDRIFRASYQPARGERRWPPSW